MDNPLLEVFNTPYQSIPFSTIQPKHFIPALKENIKNALEVIDKVVRQTDPPTFENTIEAIQDSGELLERNSAILFNLNSAETSDVIQEVTQQASPLLTQFQNDVRLNQALFERIKAIYEDQDQANLSAEQKTLLEKEYKGFARNGALLNDVVNVPARSDLMRGRFEKGYIDRIEAMVKEMTEQIANAVEAN